MRQVSKEKQDQAELSDEAKWLKSILPLDYINQALETAANSLNKANYSGTNTSPNSNSVPSLNNNTGLPPNKSSSSLNQQAHTPESSETILSLIKESNLESFEGYQVVVVNINDKDSNCPGMQNEEKVLSEQDNSASIAALFLKGMNNSIHSNSSNSKAKTRDQRHNTLRDGSSGKNFKYSRQQKLNEEDVSDRLGYCFEFMNENISKIF